MNKHADKNKEHKNQSVRNIESQKSSSSQATFQLEDNRPEAITQRKLRKRGKTISSKYH